MTYLWRITYPNHVLQSEYLSEQDKEDLLFGIKNGVDFIAASFVSTKDDVASLRQFLNDNGATCAMAIDTKAKGIVISLLSGMTVRMVSRFRPPVDIIGMTTSLKAS